MTFYLGVVSLNGEIVDAAATDNEDVIVAPLFESKKDFTAYLIASDGAGGFQLKEIQIKPGSEVTKEVIVGAILEEKAK